MSIQLNPIDPRKALNKAFLKVRPHRGDIEAFKANLVEVLDQVHELETEEFHKTIVSRFLHSTYYSPAYYINTKGRNDLVIHNGRDAYSKVGVILEAKKPNNKAEMLKKNNINSKALHELLLYYFRERIIAQNHDLKHLVVTNIYEWFIFDAAIFERTFAQNKRLVQQFLDFEEGRLGGKKTEYFYKEIAEPAIANIQIEITFTYFDIRDFEKVIRNGNYKDDDKLVTLYKILSAEHLLKLPFTNDSNTLDKAFYNELLHIIGLTEIKESGKKLIQRKRIGERNPASLIENTINQLDSLDKISRLPSPGQFGNTVEERLFNVGLELVITWINRVLFLKLLEGQLIKYHNKQAGGKNGGRSLAFLMISKVKDYDDLNTLFFQVLAKRPMERATDIGKIFENVPYLNSSLFEPTDIEHYAIFVSNLREGRMPILSSTVLKDAGGKKRTGHLGTLEYLFDFLNSYDFSSEGSEEIQEDNKTLINASVLGLIFEKINGYKDGSFFTPGFITMYMCQEAIRTAVLQKFREAKGWDCADLTALYERIPVNGREEANEIINSLKICDPAVGSGHFLVSALNEIIAIKYELKILSDRSGRWLKEYHTEVVNDELIVTDEDGNLFEYNFNNPESQRVQEALFHEKETIIENCLFGVDVNPNSVKICRLRLWIELLKNAYYVQSISGNKGGRQLETLPNIDINIKTGNSLISRFSLDSDLSQALKKSKWNMDSYKLAVHTYRNAVSKEEKRGMERLINDIKSDFRSEISNNDPQRKKLSRLSGELFNLVQGQLFTPSKAEAKARKQKQEKLEKEIRQLTGAIEEIKSNKMFENAFEWRFEFPEVLDDEGKYVGFDVVIGNPPYIQLQKMGQDSQDLGKVGFHTFVRTGDIYTLFYELGLRQLKENGVLAFITSNKWMRAAYGEPLRQLLVKQSNPLILIDFAGVQVFDTATVDTNILITEKSEYRGRTKTCALGEDFDMSFATNYFHSNLVDETTFREEGSWVVMTEIEKQIIKKIETKGVPLRDWDVQINYGIKTGLNDAFIISTEKRDELVSKCPKADEIIRPILRGRDIHKFSCDTPAQWVIYIPWHFPLHERTIQGASINAELKFREEYKAVYDHLSEYREQLENRNRAETGVRYEWYALQRFGAKYWKDFEKKKIVWGNLSLCGAYAFAEAGVYINAPSCFIATDNKYLLAVLNSKIADFYIKRLGVTRNGGYFEYKPMFVEQLPVPQITHNQKAFISMLVDKKINDPLSNPNEVDPEIENFLANLFSFTIEERAYIGSLLEVTNM